MHLPSVDQAVHFHPPPEALGPGTGLPTPAARTHDEFYISPPPQDRGPAPRDTGQIERKQRGGCAGKFSKTGETAGAAAAEQGVLSRRHLYAFSQPLLNRLSEHSLYEFHNRHKGYARLFGGTPDSGDPPLHCAVGTATSQRVRVRPAPKVRPRHSPAAARRRFRAREMREIDKRRQGNSSPLSLQIPMTVPS